jgi:hypothetical protein
MGNIDKNRQFDKVCQKLGIRDKSQRRRFHLYLNSPMHEDLSDNFSYTELLEIGKEFREIEIGNK